MTLEAIDLLERDERRDLFRLLDRIDARQRLEFLHWCCREASKNRPLGVQVTRQTGTARDVWGDVMLLAYAHDFDLRVALTELVRRIRKLGR